MTKQDFIDKCGLTFTNIDQQSFFRILDDLYLNFTKEQVINIVSDYYDNADDIFNDTKQ